LISLILPLKWKAISGAIPFVVQGIEKLGIAKLEQQPVGSTVDGASSALRISARKQQVLPPEVTVPSST
jgi:hypothetical protein